MTLSHTAIGQRCPRALLNLGRLLLRPGQRRRILREFGIRRAQNASLGEHHDCAAQQVVVYIVDGADWVTGKEKMSGGLLSIASMFEEAKKLPELRGYELVMVTLDSLPLILRHTEFDNNITVFRLSQVFSHFSRVRHLIINVPELLVPELARNLRHVGIPRLSAIDRLHVNILNQNNQKMTGPASVEELKCLVPLVTMTTGHSRCRPEDMSRKYSIAAHHLSVYVSPEQYRRRAYADKSDLLVASHDEHPMKALTLATVESKVPGLHVQVVRNLTYRQYKATIEKAKWTVTFGEGMDFYFLESVFSGGISFAVYNDEFFPAEFRGLQTVFDSYERMHEQLPGMLKALDNPAAYFQCQSTLFELLKRHASYGEYVKKLSAFYRGDYDSKAPALSPSHARLVRP